MESTHNLRGTKMTYNRKLITFICFMAFGFALLPGIISSIISLTGPLSFGEAIGEHYNSLFAERSKMELAVAWVISLGPYVAYLSIWLTVWTIRIIRVFVIYIIPSPETGRDEKT